MFEVILTRDNPQYLRRNKKQSIKFISKLKQSHHKPNLKKFLKLFTSHRATFEILHHNTSAAHGGSLCKDAGAPLPMTLQQKLTQRNENYT
jgi:hypothetical protein